jgi:hypothetical protein
LVLIRHFHTDVSVETAVLIPAALHEFYKRTGNNLSTVTLVLLLSVWTGRGNDAGKIQVHNLHIQEDRP